MAITDEIIVRTDTNMKALNDFTEQVTPAMVEDANGREFPNISKVISDSARYKVAIPFAINTQVTDALQAYSSNNVIYAPIPSLVPFNTGGSFNVSQFFMIGSYSDFIIDKTTDINTMNMLNVKKVTSKSYDGNGVGGAEWIETGVTTLSKAGTKDFSNGLIYDVNGKEFLLNVGNVVNVSIFGAKNNGVDTSGNQIQYALDYVGNVHNGGTIKLDAGTYVIEPQVYEGCLVVHKNTILEGVGKVTILKRVGVGARNLIINKNYDTIGDYGADGNIVIRNLSLTQDVVDPLVNTTNYIGFGNGDGIIVDGVYFGDARWHCLDFCRSRNGVFKNCVVINTLISADAGCVQVDKKSLGIIFGDWNHSYNLLIENNRFEESHANTIIHISHSGNFSKNIVVRNNYFNGSVLFANGSCIMSDGGGGLKDILISDNIFEFENTTKNGYRAINLVAGTFEDLESVFENITIEKNIIRGNFRNAIKVGLNDGGTAYDLTHYKLITLNVTNNFIEQNCSGTGGIDTTRTIEVRTINDCTIDNNTIKFKLSGHDKVYSAIFVDDVQRVKISKNTIVKTDIGASSTTSYGISLYYHTIFALNVNISNIINSNVIDMNNATSGIRCSTNSTSSTVDAFKKFNGIISNNSIYGDSINTHIDELFPFSDGTNNLKFVDFGSNSISGNSHTIQLTNTTALIENLPLGGKKKNTLIASRVSPNFFRIETVPAAINEFSYENEGYNATAYDASNAIGVFIDNIHMTNGTFKIKTGNAGVTYNANAGTGVPVVRTTAYFRILTGI